MADEGEIDIEGDFELKLDSESSVGYDVNELPSKSANLLPEFTNPPWMLEQGWSMDTCLDEKSKATIEKMLQEEQSYLIGRSIPKSPVKSDIRKGSTHKKPWNEEEKQCFIKGLLSSKQRQVSGLEIYGRSWKKISELIPTRTSLQVKNYAQQYFKQKNKLAEKSSVGVDLVRENVSISTTLASITTGQPTVQTGLASRKSRQKGAVSVLDNQESYHNHIELSPLKFGLSSLPSFSQTPDSLGVIQSEIGNVLLVRDLPGDMILSPGGSSAPDNSSSHGEEEDVDIDVENEDLEDNSILQNRSISPNSVYEALLKAANLKQKSKICHGASSNCETTSESLSDSQSIEDRTEDGYLNDTTKPTILNGPSVIIMTNSYHDENGLSDSAICDKSQLTVYANTILTSGGDIIELPIPESEVIFEKDEITDEERQVHTEFFDGRPSKTPQRYLKIRNYILDSWFKCKPEYLNKTSVRPGLKNCGDVNCIGRIHSYLEQCGAINFGCEQTCYNRPSRLTTNKEKIVEEKQCLNVEKIEAMRPRKRKVRDSFGFWVDEKDAEGKTIDHSRPIETPSSSISKSQKMDKYDPFKLIPCSRFEEKQPPFSVEIHSTTLAIVDIHSHISKTEVIGLLGGQYDSILARLEIVIAVPCVSISTGMQCEMDPVSQTLAAEKICNIGLCIVGWYHSHPTFAPNPSIRDLETQLKFQDWFAKGGSNFVGMIVNPYKQSGGTLQSEFRCLTVSEETSTSDQYNIPYQFDYKVGMEMFNTDVVLRTCEDVIQACQGNPHVVDLTTLYRTSDNISCLDKMLQSLQSYLPLGNDQVLSFLTVIRDMFGVNINTVKTEEVTVTVKEEPDFEVAEFVIADVALS